MLTESITKATCKQCHHRKVLWGLFGAAVVLAIVGYVGSHEKVFEYSTLWVFEQFVGGAKRALFGGGAE